MRHRMTHPKYFGSALIRCRIVAFAVTIGASSLGVPFPVVVRADCWPPLNAIEQRQSNPVRVREQTFTTGYYSWHVETYRIDNLHCEETINEGPRQWSAIVGLGGDEPIGPRVTTGNNGPQSTLKRSSLPRAAASSTPLPALPSTAPLPTMPLPALSQPARLPEPPVLPQPAALPPLTNVPLSAMPELPQLPPLPDAR